MTDEVKQCSLQFIPKLKDKKIIIRLVSGGQPVTETIADRNRG
ncbi:MAG: hypothetical protein WCP70_06005 [Methanothrix sp.]